jgi:putative transposase
MLVKKTLKLKLETTPEDRAVLYKTLQVYNQALNQIARIAFCVEAFSRNRLYYRAYGQVRTTSLLPSRLICEAIREVSWAYRYHARRNQLLNFNSTSFHLHRTAFKIKGNAVSTLTIKGRLNLLLCPCDYHQQYMGWRHREAKVVLDMKNAKVYLCLTVEKEVEQVKPKEVIGVDMGRANLATCSTGLNFKGRHAEHIRRHHSEVRKELQTKGTRSAKRRLNAIGRRENGILSWMLHNISKRIVEEAKQRSAVIALEDLTHIRENAKVRKGQRYLHHSWAFARLQSFIVYKAGEAGIPIVWVNPAYSSQLCSRCGEMGIRYGHSFFCPHCLYTTFADFNASHNLRLRGQDLLGLALAGEPHSRASVTADVH